MEAAWELAQVSQIPGVCEATTLLAMLVTLVTDNMGSIEGAEWRVKRCRSILIMLERAARVLGKVRNVAGQCRLQYSNGVVDIDAREMAICRGRRLSAM